MNDLTLVASRSIHEAMQTAPTNWQWIGPHMSQRMFGITETRAKEYAARHGGTAQAMPTSPDVTLSTGAVVRHTRAFNGSQDASIVGSDRAMTHDEWLEYCETAKQRIAR